MKYQFPEDIDQRVQACLREGKYADEDEVLREAMDALEQVEIDKRTRWQRRNQLAADQSERGMSQALDDQVVLKRLRERLAREGIVE